MLFEIGSAIVMWINKSKKSMDCKTFRKPEKLLLKTILKDYKKVCLSGVVERHFRTVLYVNVLCMSTYIIHS